MVLGARTDVGAFEETVVFLSYVKDLADPRQRGKISYPLDEILLLCLLAVRAGAEKFVDIALFGTKKLALLRAGSARSKGWFQLVQIEEAVRRDLLAHSLVQHLLELLGGMQPAECKQRLPSRLVGSKRSNPDHGQT